KTTAAPITAASPTRTSCRSPGLLRSLISRSVQGRQAPARPPGAAGTRPSATGFDSSFASRGVAMMKVECVRHLVVGVLGLWLLGSAAARAAGPQTTVEQWGLYEIALQGPAGGNPFLEVELSARFTRGDQAVTAAGFYDGDGSYHIRFMPPQQGSWRYET